MSPGAARCGFPGGCGATRTGFPGAMRFGRPACAARRPGRLSRPTVLRLSVALCAFGLAALTPPARGADSAKPPLLPFRALYTADWRSINVGVSTLELKSDAPPSQFLYTWTVSARGIFRLAYGHDIVQKSWLAVEGGHVRPLAYRADDGSSNVDIRFDWAAARATGRAESKPVDVKLAAGTQDILSIQLQVMLDLQNGSLPHEFRIIDRDEAKEFQYADEGTARLRTVWGMLDTRVISSRHDGSDRLLRMWFAPGLGFVPVQAERYRGGKLEFAMRLKTLAR